MKRSIAALLTALLLTSSLSVAFASEPSSEEPLLIPVYLFTNDGGGLLAVAPLSDEFLMWAYTANPHAVTSVGTLSFTYDTNGNQLTRSDAVTRTWDYGNRLQKTTYPATQSTGDRGSEGFEGFVRYKDELYGYDPSGTRIWLKPYGSATTTYPTAYFNTTGSTGTTTEHIVVNGIPVATVQKDGKIQEPISYRASLYFEFTFERARRRRCEEYWTGVFQASRRRAEPNGNQKTEEK